MGASRSLSSLEESKFLLDFGNEIGAKDKERSLL